jgi:hypothetical protein
MGDLPNHVDIKLSLWQVLRHLFAHCLFQNVMRSRANVKSHYDIPQEALNVYLDQVYRCYSCGLFERGSPRPPAPRF